MDFRFLIPVLFLLLTTWISGILVSNLTSGTSQAMALGQCLATLVVHTVSILFCRYFFKDQGSGIQFGKFGKNRGFVLAALCMLIGISMNLFSQWVLFCFPDLIESSISQQGFERMAELGDKWYYMVWIIFLGPILEEIFFRGYIVEQCARRNGMKMAIISGAILFSFFHRNVYMMLYTFIVGLLLNYIYVETRSLWLTILIHIGNNMTRLILPTAFYGRLVMVNVQRSLYWFVVIAMSGIIAGVGSLILIRIHLKNEQKVSGV